MNKIYPQTKRNTKKKKEVRDEFLYTIIIFECIFIQQAILSIRYDILIGLMRGAEDK